MSAALENRTNEYFKAGHLCSESVLLAFAEERGRERGSLQALAAGISAGIGCTGGLCGAVCGAALAIGLERGRTSPQEDPMPALALVEEFVGKFKNRFGSTQCIDLLGIDASTAEGKAEATAKFQRGETRCGEYCQAAARLLDELLPR